MRVRIWGCRGSIPSPGAETDRYGGNTTCVEVRLEDGSLIVIDAGTGIRKLGAAILQEPSVRRIHLLLTHAHWDHVQGFPFFVPAYLEGYSIRVHGGPLARASLRRFLAHQMDPPFFPVNFADLKASFDFESSDGEPMQIGRARIEPIPLKHPNGGYGYQFFEERRRFVFLTDNEIGCEHSGGLPDGEYAHLCRGADLVIHDAQYTEEEYRRTRGWGHSTFTAAVDLAAASRATRFGIFHHDPAHRDQDLDRHIEECREGLSHRGSRTELFGAREGMEILL
jgi:phosphoribosyl 1,2-cyclic phosphodiesterase